MVFPVHNVSPLTGVTKPEKSIMEGFKRAFAAPWPKTLRYQVTDRTLKEFRDFCYFDNEKHCSKKILIMRRSDFDIFF